MNSKKWNFDRRLARGAARREIISFLGAAPTAFIPFNLIYGITSPSVLTSILFVLILCFIVVSKGVTYGSR